MKPKLTNLKGAYNKEKKDIHLKEIQEILFRTESPVKEKFSDRHLDRENEKILLLGGETIVWKELLEAHKKFSQYFTSVKRDYEKTFPEEIYSEWRRLNGWDKKPYLSHQKPPVFAYFTKLFIYGRLPKEIMPILESLNTFLFPGIRRFKHFELLTEGAHSKIKVFIQEVIDVARSCNTMYEFRLKYASKYGVPFQMSIFQDTETILGK